MPETLQLPIDDNTLFILLALRSQGEIKIGGWDSIYDDYTNYDETIIDPECENLSSEEKAIVLSDFLNKEFDIIPGAQDNNKVILRASENSKLEQYLEKYLGEFTQYNNYYYPEETHRKRFYDFIKKKFPIVLEFEDKYFTYKLKPIVDEEKYKMIEYIAILIQRGFLCADSNTFRFNNEKGKRKKVIKLKSSSKEKIFELFKDFIEKENNNELIDQVKQTTPLCESANFILYTNKKNNVFCKSKNEFFTLRESSFTLLKYCIENEKDFIDVKEYTDKVNLNIEKKHAKKHFPLLNKDLGEIKVFKNKRGKGWYVNI